MTDLHMTIDIIDKLNDVSKKFGIQEEINKPELYDFTYIADIQIKKRIIDILEIIAEKKDQ